MFVGVHACLPLIVAGAVEWWRVGRGQSPGFTKVDLVLIGFAGLSPDILSPHFGLAARHTSLAHSFWYPALMAGGVALTAIPALRRWFPLALLAWVGVILHLACDLISGGIPLWGTDRAIVGAISIHSASWLYCDVAALLVTWFIFFRVRFLASGRKAFPTTCSWEERILEWWQGEETLVRSEEERLTQALGRTERSPVEAAGKGSQTNEHQTTDNS